MLPADARPLHFPPRLISVAATRQIRTTGLASKSGVCKNKKPLRVSGTLGMHSLNNATILSFVSRVREDRPGRFLRPRVFLHRTRRYGRTPKVVKDPGCLVQN